MGFTLDRTVDGLSSNKLKELSDKLSHGIIKACYEGKDDPSGNIRMAWSFIFAFSVGKENILVEEKSLIGGREIGLTTAATDGKVYYWNVDFLSKLSKESVSLVYAHETMHIVLEHIARGKIEEKNPIIWNFAIDMAVNQFIVRSINRDTSKDNAKDVLKGLLADMGGTEVFTLDSTITMLKNYKPSGTSNGTTATDQKSGLFADQKALDNGAEWAYNEMMKHAPPQITVYGSGEPGDMDGNGECQGQDHGNLPKGLDKHISNKEDKEKIKRDIINAAAAAANATKGVGRLPGCIEDVLGEIKDPTLSPFDLIASVIRTKAHNNGEKKNYKQYQRRPEYIYGKSASGLTPIHRMYKPTKKTFLCNYLCLLDTSGSMSNEDMAFGLKELQALDGAMGVIAKGWIIPMDTQVYWEAAVEVKNAKQDLSKTKVMGRGGTVFNEFFENIDKHYNRDDIDLIIVVSDGDFWEEPPNPSIDTVWLLTNGDRTKIPFGRKYDLRERLR